MNTLTFRAGCAVLCLAMPLTSLPALAAMPSNPVTDSRFMILPGGKDLTSIKVSGSRLSLAKGSGRSFGSTARKLYQKIRAESEADPGHKMQWALMDLDNHMIVRQSAGAGRRIFGASVTKVFTAATLLDKQEGTLSASQLQLMANMLVVSSNTAWTGLQKQIGDGSSDRGREGIHAFTQRMDYLNTRGFQGYWGRLHGNELNALELTELLYDTYTARFAGAEVMWKLMHTCRTGASRGRKYFPKALFVGGKTGTYDGTTEEPDTGRTIKVKVRNHVLVFNVEGRQYALAILADTGSDEMTSALAGGLLREFTGYRE